MAVILISEDEKDIRELIAFTLRFEGYEIISTTNGEEAYQIALEMLPDLVLLDVRMPRMCGYEVCKKLKKNETTRDIPVVFISAKGQVNEIEEGISAGAEEYILKPFSPDQLTKSINAILDNSK